MEKEMNRHICISILALTAATAAFAQDSTVVVTATKLPAPSDNIASSVSVLSARDIAVKNKSSVLDLLKDIPGLHVTQNGGVGTTSSIFIRGASTEQTLVLIDGVEINDPISPGRSPFYSNIDVTNVERIEVVRGAQSSLYGSDAVAGVINIVTRKGEGKPSAYAEAEGGAFNTYRGAAGVSGASDNTHYSVSYSYFDTEGISSANEKDGNTEKDGATHSTVSARVGHRINDTLAIDAVARYIDSESEFDASGGPGGDADDNIGTRKSIIGAVSADLDLFDSIWQQTFKVSSASHERTSKSAYGDSTFDSSLLKGDWQNNILCSDNNILIIGLESETEEGETDSINKLSSDTFSIFAQDIVELNQLIMAIGLRWDDREEFEDETTYRIAPVYKLNDGNTRLKGTYGTGFKAPSLYQLYAPASTFGPVGNADLKPEKSKGWDLGLEQVANEGDTTIGITYFSTEYEDMIAYESGYVNKSEAETSGIELSLKHNISDCLSISGHYTYLDTKDLTTGDALSKRPENRAYADLTYFSENASSLSISCLYVDERPDRVYEPSMAGYVNAMLDSYFLVNVSGTYMVNDNLELFARIDNILDEEYEEITGYGTPGISAFGGVRITL
ncbi:hypothetical protein BVX97_06230 [bacterium E08(2017)]|nr:hypothetical protein BVX97_06230 [bacterium E08(2017)]